MILRRHITCGSGGVSFVVAGIGLVTGSFVLGGGSGSGRDGVCTCGVPYVVA